MKAMHKGHSTTICEIGRMLSDVRIELKKREQAIGERFSITPPQYLALHYLNEQGDLTIGELSQRMNLACSTLTDLIDRMEKNRFVKRVRDQRDRRVVQIHLLPRGQQVMRSIMEARCDELVKAFASLSSSQVDALANQLALLHETLCSE